jgi:hypothetical protein
MSGIDNLLIKFNFIVRVRLKIKEAISSLLLKVLLKQLNLFLEILTISFAFYLEY